MPGNAPRDPSCFTMVPVAWGPSTGSIFPSSPAGNPQLSIMAMASRLAQHLDGQVL